MTPRTLLVAGTALALAACAPSQSSEPPKNTLVVGIDASGSFRGAHYDDAVEFAAAYLYGHLHGLGGLRVPTAVFVGSVGGSQPGDAKAFHPIHDFRNKSAAEIAQDLRTWFPPEDALTDFNAFFDRVATLVKRQNLVLAPLDIVILSDGVPDTGPKSHPDSLAPYATLSVDPLEFISRSVTVRLLYPTPTVAVGWERGMPRNRVRLWTVAAEVMQGWHEQVTPGTPLDDQDALWSWVRDNVDFRVRSRVL
jgi:hypothetical protein